VDREARYHKKEKRAYKLRVEPIGGRIDFVLGGGEMLKDYW